MSSGHFAASMGGTIRRWYRDWAELHRHAGWGISLVGSRACLVVVTCLAAFVFWVPSANAQCGQTTSVGARRSLGPGPPPLAVGDSVLYDAAQALSYYGFEANAMVCRTMAQGIVWLGDHAQRLPALVVVALGTNGAVTVGQDDQLSPSLIGRRSVTVTRTGR